MGGPSVSFSQTITILGLLFLVTTASGAATGQSQSQGGPPSAATPLSTVEVETPMGPVIGVQESKISIFKGLPYAKAPEGELRWKAPEPISTWNEPLDATSFGSSCIQITRPAPAPDPGPQSEDCLFLNVWAPNDLEEPAPVLVWIHGGAFVLGSSSFPFYDGKSFAESGVVFVSMNYRLGRFGFFAHPALHEETPVSNFAFLDQIAALEWVRDNISAFGGDPSNVTIGGESAGGVSVTHLLSAPQARGLFHKAIVQSGSGHRVEQHAWQARGRRAPSADLGIDWAKKNGLSGGAATPEALRSIPAKDVLGERVWAGQPLRMGPSIDGVTVMADVASQFEKANQARVPMLIGATSYEASLAENVGTRPRQILNLLRPRLPQARTAYANAGQDLSDRELAYQAYGDATFVAPARYLARFMAKSGVPVWLYHFDVVPEAQRGSAKGTRHGGDIPYVFDLIDELPQLAEGVGPSDRSIAQNIHRAWVAFISNGDPNHQGLSNWALVDTESTPTLHVQAGGAETDLEFEAEIHDYFDDRFQRLRRLFPMPGE